MRNTNTLIITHRKRYRDGLKLLLNIAIPYLNVNTANSFLKVNCHNYSFLIVEPLFNNLNDIPKNIDTIAELSNKGIRICLLVDNISDIQLLNLLENPIIGVLFKKMKTSEIISAVENIMKGIYFIPPKVGKLLLDVYQKNN